MNQAPPTKESQWQYFAQWLELTVKERKQRGLPATQDELAAKFHLADARTLRKWKTEPAFQALQAKTAKTRNPLKARPVTSQPETGYSDPLAASLSDLTSLEALEDQGTSASALEALETPTAANLGDEYLKHAWREKALDDPRAMRIYWDAWGKNNDEAERKAKEVHYDAEELENLIMLSVMELGEDIVVGWLRDNGWNVEKEVDSNGS